eukprot:CAMPEP_0119315924 /NCGR_PEP_ID=MMETSP1333-20130426/37766_1 /TAXON_ID=418940 /ORGANISM="Scyphosphaera apsteinii, Strain RCC1455" /LENGTH=73 /DNA_ID=CAMNT_0007321427 /DNA_START=34 /DNA_END=255 /DNA_ORIENTATION=+
MSSTLFRLPIIVVSTVLPSAAVLRAALLLAPLFVSTKAACLRPMGVLAAAEVSPVRSMEGGCAAGWTDSEEQM